jgi:hypothetical protein
MACVSVSRSAHDAQLFTNLFHVRWCAGPQTGLFRPVDDYLRNNSIPL